MAAGEVDSDDVLGLDVAGEESVSDLVGAGVKLGVGEGVFGQGERGRVWAEAGLAGDEVRNKAIGQGGGGVIPRRQIRQFFESEDGLIAYGAVRLRQQVVEQGQEMIRQASNGVLTEQ